MSTSEFDLNTISTSSDERVPARSTVSTLLPSFSVEYYHKYASGWCHECGRKRGADGRCIRCDSWWTSPLLLFGFPLTLAVTALFLLILPNFQSRPPRHDLIATVQKVPAQRASFFLPIANIPRPRVPQYHLPSLPVLPRVPNIPDAPPQVYSAGPDMASLRRQIAYAASYDQAYDKRAALQQTIMRVPQTSVPNAVIPRPVPTPPQPFVPPTGMVLPPVSDGSKSTTVDSRSL